MSEAQKLMEELSSLVSYKDSSGNYNKLKETQSVDINEIVGYRDKKIIKCADPEGYEYKRDDDGFIIPESIDEILARAYKNSASDIHITSGAPPKMRVHGELLQMPYEFLTPELTRKLLSPLINAETQLIFDQEGDLDFAYSLKGVCRFRVNLFKQRGAWSAVFRSLSTNIPDAEVLGIPKAILDMATRKRGMVLVTGPTGSGKSTTLAAIIDQINKTRRENIITLEDPIEYIHTHNLSNVNQREIGADTKSFASAVRAALREDPDVILVGEMRDPETISTAITAAETGHLVFSTLHTIGAAATIDRIVDSFPHNQQDQIRAQLASVLECVVSQQLIPLQDGKGRVCAFEIMVGTVPVKHLIRENKIPQISQQMELESKEGSLLMDTSITKLYAQGKISKDKAIEFAVDKLKMQAKLK